MFLEHSHVWYFVTFLLYNAQVLEGRVPTVDGTFGADKSQELVYVQRP